MRRELELTDPVRAPYLSGYYKAASEAALEEAYERRRRQDPPASISAAVLRARQYQWLSMRYWRKHITGRWP